MDGWLVGVAMQAWMDSLSACSYYCSSFRNDLALVIQFEDARSEGIVESASELHGCLPRVQRW